MKRKQAYRVFVTSHKIKVYQVEAFSREEAKEKALATRARPVKVSVVESRATAQCLGVSSEA